MYVSENGVLPVELFGVVQYAHKMLGSFSTHFLFAYSRRFLIPSNKVLVEDSA